MFCFFFWGCFAGFLGGFGCCFVTVQLLVCLIDLGLAVSFGFVGLGVMRVWLFEWLEYGVYPPELGV